jgi:hypothetical protein
VARYVWRANIHEDSGDALKQPFVSFPQKEESIWPFKVNMDSRFFGNEGLASGHRRVLVDNLYPPKALTTLGPFLRAGFLPRVAHPQHDQSQTIAHVVKLGAAGNKKLIAES